MYPDHNGTTNSPNLNGWLHLNTTTGVTVNPAITTTVDLSDADYAYGFCESVDTHSVVSTQQELLNEIREMKDQLNQMIGIYKIIAEKIDKNLTWEDFIFGGKN